MHMQPVTSSWIESVGHDPATNTMHLRTRSGREYQFPDTSAEEHARLMAADSQGKHFNRHIRGKLFRFVAEPAR
jgi:KTSC domain